MRVIARQLRVRSRRRAEAKRRWQMIAHLIVARGLRPDLLALAVRNEGWSVLVRNAGSNRERLQISFSAKVLALGLRRRRIRQLVNRSQPDPMREYDVVLRETDGGTQVLYRSPMGRLTRVHPAFLSSNRRFGPMVVEGFDPLVPRIFTPEGVGVVVNWPIYDEKIRMVPDKNGAICFLNEDSGEATWGYMSTVGTCPQVCARLEPAAIALGTRPSRTAPKLEPGVTSANLGEKTEWAPIYRDTDQQMFLLNRKTGATPPGSRRIANRTRPGEPAAATARRPGHAGGDEHRAGPPCAAHEDREPVRGRCCDRPQAACGALRLHHRRPPRADATPG